MNVCFLAKILNANQNKQSRQCFQSYKKLLKFSHLNQELFNPLPNYTKKASGGQGNFKIGLFLKPIDLNLLQVM
jgi:hypothetical protein